MGAIHLPVEIKACRAPAPPPSLIFQTIRRKWAEEEEKDHELNQDWWWQVSLASRISPLPPLAHPPTFGLCNVLTLSEDCFTQTAYRDKQAHPRQVFHWQLQGNGARKLAAWLTIGALSG